MQNQFDISEFSHTKVVFPNNLNDNNTLFGGEAIKWMDEFAYIIARKLSGKKMVTTSIDRIRFHKSIPVGTIIEIKAEVVKIGAVKLEIMVNILIEYENEIFKAIEGLFTLVAVDFKNKLIPLNI